MVDGILGLPEVENPQRAASQTLQQMQMMPGGVMQAPGAAAQPQQGYMGPQNLNEIYGILAGGNNPGGAGQGYVDAMQNQQRIDTSNSPLEQYLRLYGNVNPYDFTTESLSDFHNTLVKTGDMAQAFKKLERVETLSTKEQGYLNDSITQFSEAERSTARMMGLAQRFESANQQGIRTGALGQLEDWFVKFAGNEGDFQLLRQEYDQLRNREVIQSLPKGPASDKDIAIAQKGWPPATANAAYVAAFMRGMAKMKAIEQAQAAHQADFIGRHRKQEGQLADWARDKEYWILKAIDGVGGVYNPLNPDGTPMTAEQAAQARYGDTTRVGGGPAAAQPTDQAATAAADVVGNVESTLEKYRKLRASRRNQ
jgi:hypothetical protein